MFSPLKLCARRHGAPSKLSSTEQWHHTGKNPDIAYSSPWEAELCSRHPARAAPSWTLFCSAFLKQICRAGPGKKALLSAQLEEGSTTSSKAAPSPRCFAGLAEPAMLGAGKWQVHLCGDQSRMRGCKKQNLGTAWMLSGNFFPI